MSVIDFSLARRTVERLMSDTGVLNRPITDGTLDTTTGEITYAGSSSIYTGKCKVRETAGRDQVREGGVDWSQFPYLIGIPFDSPEPKVDDVLTILTSSNDPFLVGKSFLILKVGYSTVNIQRRMGAELSL